MNEKQKIHRQFSLDQVTFIMLIVTLVAPLVALWQGGTESEIDVSIIAITWVFLPLHWDNNVAAFGVYGGGLHLLNPAVILNTSILWIFNALFTLYVIRYYQERTSKRFVLLLGGLTLLLPLINVLMAVDYLWKRRLLVYIGPIPIQLIVGLLLIRQKTLDKDVCNKKSDSPSELW